MAEINSDSHSTARVTTLAALPSVDVLLNQKEVLHWQSEYGQSLVVKAIRQVLEQLRAQFGAGQLYPAQLELPALVAAIDKQLQQLSSPRMQQVINLGGTVLHTNLGRALLPEQAIDAVVQAMRFPVNLEYDIDSGQRGDRDNLVLEQLCALTGAEAATIVNNNAAAVFLLLNTLAFRQQVVVSRGELVEIGGSFRIPDIMSRAGVRLREVGTTNRTHAFDYERAINARTALLMRVHCSNYAIQGFTKTVPLNELVSLGAAHDVATAVDLGSGTLINMADYGLPDEPTVQQSIEQGAQVVSFSGDKLLGGPQAGLIVGSHEQIQAIKDNPLKRMLRVGKMTLAALEAVLALYQQPELLAKRLPTLRLLTRPVAEIRAAALYWQPIFQRWVGTDFAVRDEAMYSQIGSGALPVDSLPSHGLCLSYQGAGRGNQAVRQLVERLRRLPTPVVGRVHRQALYLDFRCLSAAEADLLKQNLNQNN